MRDNSADTADQKEHQPDTDTDRDTDTTGTPAAAGGLWGRRSIRIAASLAAAVLAAGIVLGVTNAVRGSVPADARIPFPPAKNAVFVEDDNGPARTSRTTSCSPPPAAWCASVPRKGHPWAPGS